uniref:N-acetyltransferase domain-containing protein n=1 Tax=Arion vulgaris TaxID=1028688 RepID=A0A0B6ZRM4_9EUPU
MANTRCESYTIRTLRPEEVEDTYKLIDKEGWNLTLDKFSALYKTFPNLFFVAATDKDEVAATMSLYPTFKGEYVMGNIVVKDGHRKKGLGRKIMDDVLAMYPEAAVSLTAVPGADQFYINTGFEFTEPQQGHDIFHLILDRGDLDKRLAEMGEGDSTFTLYDPSSYDDLLVYDLEAKGYPNVGYIEMQILCFKVIIAKDSAGRLVGYGVAFVKRNEIVLDGLYADSDSKALGITREILNHFPDRNTMKIQVPSSRLFLSELGHITSSSKYNRYSKGHLKLSPLSKVYNVGDCDFTY